MPIIITKNGPKWVPDINRQNGISLGNRRTQKESLEQRQEGTIISTARALKYQRDGNNDRRRCKCRNRNKCKCSKNGTR
jgi:hypothetical protein